MTTVTAPVTPRERVARLAADRIDDLQREYLADRSLAVAALARLRRGAGRDAGQLPDLWALIDTGSLHYTPDGARPMSESELVRAEDALHVALTLYALHQQSRSTGMHQADRPDRRRGLGAAVRRMMKPGEIDEPVHKRLVRAGTAPDLTTLAQRLREIVVLLRREGFELDYALLAGQLYTWQRPGGVDAVRREWGRSFHALHDKSKDGRPPLTAGVTADTDTTSTTDTDKDAS
ncbi:type I-E CRISPR-associated protein Cse2/CasB [Streptomyces sp. M2CJ-2]|uniref:type I-E CRISPR-associated protein Cse2/CasB n=1 Tax=Streptomyces sp. M2CJ-2 TaxID=2803948 RepID=UPI00192929BB|nr:type I-E CRISPR-associated protein Cse2/CasB [Streptomyces sp. M2CJ-2]MBL3670137.1 type I-E CRISPR-associated protein Cse2/CasB [Streptomyces sp. M2CJ-2]